MHMPSHIYMHTDTLGTYMHTPGAWQVTYACTIHDNHSTHTGCHTTHPPKTTTSNDLSSLAGDAYLDHPNHPATTSTRPP